MAEEIKRFCTICGKEFFTASRKRRYCSKRCAEKNKKFAPPKILAEDIEILKAQGYGFSAEVFKKRTLKEAVFGLEVF